MRRSPESSQTSCQSLKFWRRGSACLAVIAAVFLGTAPPTAAQSPATFPMVDGELAATCFSGFNLPNNPSSGVNASGFVVAVIDARIPPCCANPVPVVDTNWPAPMFHNEFPVTANTWSAANLGQVFGLALDDQSPPNIYVSATTAYGLHPVSASGPAAVFQINGSTGAISPFIVTGAGTTGTNTLANSGPGLGNICHDPVHNQFFVSNFENGEITRHGPGGIILSRLDPFAPDGGSSGFAPLGERIWGVQVFQGRLYFGVWLRDGARQGTPWPVAAGPAPTMPNNSVWSIALDAGTGDFVGVPLLEVVVPYIPSPNQYSNPVSDIAFSATGAMILGERTMNGDVGSLGTAHVSRVLHYTGGSGSWAPSGLNFSIGRDIVVFGLRMNSAGGVDFDCDENVWSTGDALHFTGGDLIYGLQRVPFTGNTNATATTTSYLIDLDGNTTTTAKTYIGDVETYLIDPCGNPLEVCPLPPTNAVCEALQDRDCQTPLPENKQCLPKTVIVDSGIQGVLHVELCDCIEGCGAVDVQGDLIRCPGVCPDPPPGEFCQIHFNGVPQGVPQVVISQVPDGTEITCDCERDPQVCPVPPNNPLCANLQNTDCVNGIGECLPQAVLVDFNQANIFEVLNCGCIEGCGAVDIQGDLLRCPNVCPIQGQLCQIHFDGVPQGVPVVINTQVPNGTIVTCDCDDDPPMICEPTQDRLGCEPFVCPVAGEECKPRCVRDDGTGFFAVEDCECRGPEECFIVHDLGIPPFCEGLCPPGEVCVQTISFDPVTGDRIICCDCEPEEPCGPAPGGQTCLPVTCPDPTEQCIAKCVVLEANGVFSVAYCECDNPDDCHIELIAGADPICVGQCPPNEVCELTVFTNPDGTAEFCCECLPDPPFCEPTDDEQDCKPFVCPDPNDECRPRCIREDVAAGTFTVIDCDCRPFDECHVEYIPGVGARCEGACPPGFTCLENRIDNGDGTIDICCECVRKPCKCPGDINGDNLINGLDIQGFINCLLGTPTPEDNCTCADLDGDGVTTLADLDPFIAKLFTRVPCVPPACPPEDLVVDLATGVDDDGSLIPFNTADDDWIVTGEPPPTGTLPRPADVIVPHPAWLTIPGTRWISADRNGPNGAYTYEFCFCLDGRFSNPQLSLLLRADDAADVFLNGTPIGSAPPGSFNSPTPTSIIITDPNLFVVGENCVTVVVRNISAVVTGLNLAGRFVATDGQCCCDEADLDTTVDSGVDDSGGLIPIGGDDTDWTVTVDAAGGTVPRPATVITPNGAWLTIPGTQWISANSTGPNGLYVYEHCFCLDERFENAQLTLDLRADDFATVCLNGVHIGATPSSYAFNTPQPTHIFVTNQDLFVCGKNCIEIKVTNSHGVVTGLNVAGQITADKGLCCCAPSPDGLDCCPRECENPEERCVSRCVHIDPNGIVRVTDCDCRSPDECRVAPITPGELPVCIGGCPPGEQCVDDLVMLPDGSMELCCDCVPVPPLGACCLPNGNCIITNITVCEAHMGLYLGDNTLCQGDEACCLPDGSCIVVDAACCGQQFGGTPQGAGSACQGDANGNGIDDACEDPQQEFSCCDDEGFCVDLIPGVFECPPGSTLVVGPCGFQQACCLPSGICIDAFVACCLHLGGTPQGLGSVCSQTMCPSDCGPNNANTACRQVECPNPDEKCTPRCATIDPASGKVLDLDCECRPFDQCFAEIMEAPAFGVECIDSCPPGQTCVRTVTQNADGSFTICCDCEPIEPMGSCCDATGGCFPEPVGGCPPGTTPHPDPCDPPQACCLPNNTCVDLEPQCCQDLGGMVTSGLCTGIVEGCCLPDGTCVDLDPQCCLALQGMPQPAPCQPPQACCFLPPFAAMCIDTDPQCCQQAGGTPQGPGTFCMGDNDGDGVDDACQDPPPGICPLPQTPVPSPCADLQASQCPQGAPGQECVPRFVIIGVQGQTVFVEQCECLFPEGCGRINIIDNILACPGMCPPDERCQIFIDGNPTGLGSIDATTLAPGTAVNCDCGP
ncbi:MAG: dockerin type I repeat-containing protein [Phycisphaerales bacterium]|nr:dockerin type I repeat-containing protein [Phycisphaerales bacterium]